MSTAEDVLRARIIRANIVQQEDADDRRASYKAEQSELAEQIKHEIRLAGKRLANLPTPFEGGMLLTRWLGGRDSEEVAVWHVATHEGGHYYTYGLYFAPTLDRIFRDQTQRARQTAKNITQQRTDPERHDAIHAGWLMGCVLENTPNDDLQNILDGLRRLGQPTA